jgi:outer membrane usher protein
LDYAWAGSPFGVRASLKYLSSDYRTITPFAAGVKPQFEGSIGLGFSNRLIGSLSGNFSYILMQDGTDKKKFSFSYSRRLLRNLSIQAMLNGTFENGSQRYEGLVTANLFLRGLVGSLNYSNDNGLSKFSSGVQSIAAQGTGFGYRADVEAAQGGTGIWNASGDASIQYRSPWGVYNASATYDFSQNYFRYNLSTAGSIVAIDSSLLFGRPVYDSFALVRMDGLKGVRVKSNGEYVGVTNRKGKILVPDLVAYVENELSAETADIPLSYDIASAVAYVSPPYRGGAVVEFKTVRFQACVGKLFFVEQGKRIPAEYAGLEVQAGQQAVSTVVGMGGDFYIENIPPGKHRARLFTTDKDCSFELVVPESEETLVDLGEIECPVQR